MLKKKNNFNQCSLYTQLFIMLRVQREIRHGIKTGTALTSMHWNYNSAYTSIIKLALNNKEKWGYTHARTYHQAKSKKKKKRSNKVRRDRPRNYGDEAFFAREIRRRKKVSRIFYAARGYTQSG